MTILQIKVCKSISPLAELHTFFYVGDLSLPQTTEHAGYISWKDW